MGLRLGFLTHLHIGRDAPDSYRIALDLFAAAEELGYDTGWVAQHHFHDNDGRLPSSLTFLAAAAERTRRIRLGTAIVILPLEDPVRVAEDASVVDAISGGRLELGLGTGGDPLTFAAFGRDVEARRERFAEAFDVLSGALAGRPINGTDAVLYPPANGLSDRLWGSTLSPEGGRRMGRAGIGLLLARTAFLSKEPTDVAQRPVAEAYLAERASRPGPPRIGLSRCVYPAADRRTAVADLAPGVAEYVESMVRRGHFPPGLDQEAGFRRTHVHCGHPEEVVASLRADRVLEPSTELICQSHPGRLTADQVLRSLELIAREVAPALGWTPAVPD
ncbi:MAG TPA: LLM class flavin-dependent oxidoreductase [Candidatus Dormibacteraeota bacterium]|nr:LLM class flavin-dependent oxidoreductase [Candidatus Dormibacteraeota bacterium]